MLKTMNIGIDHGYYAIKTRHFSFPAGIAVYSHEPYTLQNTLEYGGKFYVCGTGRQPILRNKTENDNYYLLTLAAIAREIKQRGENTECSVTLAAGLPLAGFGREKKFFREYLLRSSQPVCFKFEGVPYARCLTAGQSGSFHKHRGEASGVWNGCRIRRLTPKECLRLQGWQDDRIEKVLTIQSDAQLYKQAGNGVTVTVVEAIGKRLSAANREVTAID